MAFFKPPLLVSVDEVERLLFRLDSRKLRSLGLGSRLALRVLLVPLSELLGYPRVLRSVLIRASYFMSFRHSHRNVTSYSERLVSVSSQARLGLAQVGAEPRGFLSVR